MPNWNAALSSEILNWITWLPEKASSVRNLQNLQDILSLMDELQHTTSQQGSKMKEEVRKKVEEQKNVQ